MELNLHLVLVRNLVAIHLLVYMSFCLKKQNVIIHHPIYLLDLPHPKNSGLFESCKRCLILNWLYNPKIAFTDSVLRDSNSFMARVAYRQPISVILCYTNSELIILDFCHKSIIISI
jgi:hypothetical protein